MKTEKIGAVLYGIWGIAHVVGGLLMMRALMVGGAGSYLGTIATAVDPASLGAPVPAAANSVFAFHAFNLIWIGAFVVGIAPLNWRNSVAGFWLNLAVVGATDIGLVATTLIPGYMALGDGLLGPLLLVGAVTFTIPGLLRRRAHSAGVPATAPVSP